LPGSYCCLLTTAQPIPANDAFFYDGAVVNLLLHGKYVNPRWRWRCRSRRPKPSAPTRHFTNSRCCPGCLFSGRRLSRRWHFTWRSSGFTADRAGHFPAAASCFLGSEHSRGIFFDPHLPRPSGQPGALARLSGALFLGPPSHGAERKCSWLLPVAVAHGALRRLVPVHQRADWLGLFHAHRPALPGAAVVPPILGSASNADTPPLKSGLPAGPLAVMTLTPAALIALVFFGYPNLWAGFLEHARQTPSFIGRTGPPSMIC